MKTKIIVGVALVVGISAIAQENDDMYFRSKDREKLNVSAVSKASEKDAYASNYSNFKKKHFDETTMLDEYTNPTDSYSARNINPEFIARSNSEQASEDESNYFVEGYNSQITNTGYTNYSNTTNWNNPMYASGYYGSSYYNSMYSPYYGWNDPWSNPYWSGCNYNSGWSMSASYYWGNSWASGWNYGLGYTWGNPYYYGGLYNNWYRPYTVVVVGEGSRPNYGKRQTRSSVGVSDASNHYVRTNTQGVNSGSSGGRIRNTSDEYYVRPSRRTYTDSNSSYSSNPYSIGTRSSGTNSSRSSYNTSSGLNYDSRSSGFSSPSRSSSGSYSSPTRSSSGSSSGGSRRGGN